MFMSQKEILYFYYTRPCIIVRDKRITCGNTLTHTVLWYRPAHADIFLPGPSPDSVCELATSVYDIHVIYSASFQRHYITTLIVVSLYMWRPVNVSASTSYYMRILLWH